MSSATLSKQPANPPKAPLPSQHNAQMLIRGDSSSATALNNDSNTKSKGKGVPAPNAKLVKPGGATLGTLGSNSSLNLNFKNPQENSSCQMTQFNYNQSGHLQQNNQLSQDLFYGRYPHDETSNDNE